MDVGSKDLFLHPEVSNVEKEGTLRIMQWNFSPTMEIGQYVCLPVAIVLVSSNGTHFA